MYRDGRRADELAAQVPAGNWALHTSSTWHRHLSFFGVGPGGRTLQRWKNGAIEALTSAAYAERTLPAGTLDRSRLAVLADALVLQP